MIIRPATIQDIPAMLVLENIAFKAPWHEDHFRYELTKNPYAFVFVATQDDQLLGFIDFWITFEQAQINNVAVFPHLRRKKIATTLLTDALLRIHTAGCTLVTLEVRVSNLGAQALYRQHGFHQTLIKPHYYADGEDAYMMEKSL